MYDVIIIGGGPTGLSCGIEAKYANLSYLIVEKGGITDCIRRFPVNMTFFSTPELLELGNIPFPSVNVRPNRLEVLNYYRRVVEYFNLEIRLHTRVTNIEKNNSFFSVNVGDRDTFKAKHVICAIGYFDFTNRLNVPGEDTPHVSHYYTEPFAYSQMDTVVVGGRNSAVETALDLYRHGSRVALVHRGPSLGSVKYWVLPDITNRIKEGAIRVYFNSVVNEIRTDEIIIRNNDTNRRKVLKADFVIPLIGYRPDEKLLRNAGIRLHDRTLIPEYNPKTFETNVPGLYIAGSVACGCETWNIFIENGKAHALPIISDISNHT